MERIGRFVQMDLEEIQLRKKMAEEFKKELDRKNEQIKNGLKKEQREFVKDAESLSYWNKKLDSNLARQLYNGLRTGKYKKPSEFFKKETKWMFDGYILPRFKESFLYAVDNRIKYQYSDSYYRRSFRTSDYSIHIYNIFQIIKGFHRNLCIDRDICDVLKNNIQEQEKAYIESERWETIGYNKELISYELDHGNKELEDIITDIVMGENEIVLDRQIIGGIIQSENEKMHKLLGKLLLAARLQEGLRQAICEPADSGTVSAFMEILNVIKENNLIRFSSVKRAVGTWIGLLNSETGDLERISDKSLELIIESLSKESVREEYLNSEDSMKIYIALWSNAFYEVRDAMDRVYKIADNGTHHQLLTSGYFIQNIDNENLNHELSKKIIGIMGESILKKEDVEYDVLAVYMPYFMSDWSRCKEIDKYYKDSDEAEKYYNILMAVYNDMPKKELEFSPCIFPWNTAVLSKAYVIARLCITALYLDDNEKIDFTCGLIKDTSNRSYLLEIMLEHPKTPVQKMVLTRALCDRESYTRKKAFALIKKVGLTEENYAQMEDMLKYKAADMRSNLIELLYGQDDDSLYGTVERLISDKKEEKRTASLDIIMQIKKDDSRTSLYERCVPLAKSLTDASTKEKILIENIIGGDEEEDISQDKILYTDEDKYVPDIPDNEKTDKFIKAFMDVFPDSRLKDSINKAKLKTPNLKKCKTAKQALEDCRMLSECIYMHRNDEYKRPNGEVTNIDSDNYFHSMTDENSYDIPLLSVWREWYEDKIGSVNRLIRMYILMRSYSKSDKFTEKSEKYIKELYGNGFEEYPHLDYAWQLTEIIDRLLDIYMDKMQQEMVAAALGIWYVKCFPKKDVILENGRSREQVYAKDEMFSYFIYHQQIISLMSWLCCNNDEYFPVIFPIAVLVSQKTFDNNEYKEIRMWEYKVLGAGRVYNVNSRFSTPAQTEYIIASYRNIISEGQMYYFLFDKRKIGDSLNLLSYVASANREQGRQVSDRNRYSSIRRKSVVSAFIENSKESGEPDGRLLKYADDIYETVINRVLKQELKRGDSPTIYSEEINSVHRIYGLKNFVSILSALGKDTLERAGYWYYGIPSKKRCLSHLLSVCIPDNDDNAKKLKSMVKGTDITDMRLIEAALFSPEWIDIVGEYLGWKGFNSACYYFMAHMNEAFDDKRKAVIARYTPLTSEELNSGAFDIDWFKSSYETLGDKKFQMIYKAAKYISDGSKHSRARKYADAALGKMDVSETEAKISDKRNKDLLMAYSLIPLKNEDDVSRRYLFLQKFLKESRQFGSQRIASEKKAVEMSMSNLAMNAGYTDVTRLTLRMETKLIDDSKDSFNDKEIEDVTMRLEVDDNGKASIICVKDGKKLKSVPARLKKNEYVVSLTALKKKLTDQYRRTKTLFEQAMEDGTEFTVDEIAQLQKNPVVLPILRDLVFISSGKIGFLKENVMSDYNGNETVLKYEDKAIAAHPLHLYKDGHWTEYQKNLFDRKAVQPFKQVFRELYVKTEEEKDMNHSLRYAGNQIQPAKTVACLKSRRWVADIEDGLQKVYYKENVVARIYAMADWFTPADIEAPTLEWVEFSDRNTGKNIAIKDVPDIIFSEVMRDVDLAVSVAHAGGIDPETSHSTVEMRAALLTFTLPLFKISNVSISGSHALVKGKFGDYTIHLGSGVIHKQGGTMINVLPVHSQHRGKLFLPFADDDPKTAEIISKVLLFADDGKIKDPSILEQIKA